MKKEYIVMLLICGVIVLSLCLFVKKNNIRKALFAAIAAQALTWPIGLLVVALGLVEYPVRLFPKAVDSSFLNGFLMNPSIYSIYYVHYPKHTKLVWKWVYTIVFTAIPALLEFTQEKYTDLIRYENWSGYKTWILLLISYYILRRYLDWYFANLSKQGELYDKN